jgi:hypothetical protein
MPPQIVGLGIKEALVLHVEEEKPVDSGDAATPFQLPHHCRRGRENEMGAPQLAASSPASTRCPPSCKPEDPTTSVKLNIDTLCPRPGAHHKIIAARHYYK